MCCLQEKNTVSHLLITNRAPALVILRSSCKILWIVINLWWKTEVRLRSAWSNL